jgi:hypothetical protein
MLQAIFTIGDDLIRAKGELDHGEFQFMIDTELPFGRRTAQMMMAVARDDRLRKANTCSLLPPHWRTLYQITWLEDGPFDRLIDNCIIRPEITYAEINKVLRLEKVEADEARVLALQPIAGKFRTLVFDPAWDYERLSLATRSKPGYAVQSLDDLRALDVRRWADSRGCHLYCWATNNFLSEAHKLVEQWGFQHRTVLTWIKPPPFGLGSYFRNSTEHVI